MIEKQRALWPWNCAPLAILGAFTALVYPYFHMLLLQ